MLGKERENMSLKKKIQKSIKNLAANSVGKSYPTNIHEPKIPAALKAAKDSQK